MQEWAGDLGIPTDGALVNLPRHPTQIYEGLLEGVVLWLIIWFIIRKRNPFDGFIIGFYVIAYGAIRFFLDYYRMPISADDFAIRLVDTGLPVYFVQSPLNLIPSQLYSLGMVIAGVIFLVVVSKRPQRPVILTLAEPSGGGGESETHKPSRRVRQRLRKSK